MATAEAEQIDTLQRASANEPVAEGQEAILSKISVLTHSSESKLSAIIEEDSTPRDKFYTTTNFQKERLEQLSHPKLLHLEETLGRFENITKNHEVNERIVKIKMRLLELRSEKPVRQIRTGKSSIESQNDRTFSISQNTKEIYSNLQSSLRKAAFETLVKQIFDKLPKLLITMEQTRAQQTAPEMKTLLDTLQATLEHYLGQPTQEHEKRVYNYLCYGLAKFIENVIENVHKNQQEDERVAQDEKPGNGHLTLAVQLARKAYKERP
ncbi:uncharacterized protein LOC128309446 [Anopheles moucheti]|uniref:uncharacterized protein LOC128309446 n=1 Tax=Anopheles moucheti TaxID=186751 RepID=UPI0022F0CB91|nr:uncharacterized protein LOC128309446 [Anopheles moucheti]